MKIFTRISILVAALFIQVSCNDWLELEPPNGLIREEFWQTKEDVESAVMGAYHTFAALDDMLFKYGEMRGDLVAGSFNIGSDERKIMNGSIDADNTLSKWNEFYKVINYCNEVIYFAPSVREKDKTFTEYMLYGFLSEAYYLRSLSYFYLVRIFKDVPLVLEPSISDASNLYLKKSTEDEIISHINADLIEARKWATVDGYLTIIDNKGRATKAAFDALLADIALWTFDYEACITYCNNVLSSPKYDLLPGSDWFENYYPGNTLESVFEFQLDDYTDDQANGLYDLTRYEAYNYVPSDFAIELFDPQDEDDERDLYRGLGVSIKEQDEGVYIIWKYVGMIGDNMTGRPGAISKSANFIVYRLADIYLMKAEALAMLERFPESLNMLMEIWERASVTPNIPSNNRNKYEDIILRERARELAFEGKRWFDLLRMGRRNNYARKADLINLMVQNVPSTQKRILQTKLTNPYSWYMPIFKEEMERNKNLVQNPYYNF